MFTRNILKLNIEYIQQVSLFTALDTSVPPTVPPLYLATVWTRCTSGDSAAGRIKTLEGRLSGSSDPTAVRFGVWAAAAAPGSETSAAAAGAKSGSTA